MMSIKRDSPAASAPKRVLVSEAVTERIVGLIKDGSLRAGSKLPPETELMKQFNVGRSTVREALRGLAMLGIVSARPRHGTVIVSPISGDFAKQLNSSVIYWAVRDLFAVRAVLESYSASEAARRATASEIAEIARAQSALEAKVLKKKTYFNQNREFHSAIARAAHNGVLFFCLSGIIGGLKDVRQRMHDMMPQVPERDVADHRAILRAIRQGDSDEAGNLMSNHLLSQVRELKIKTDKKSNSSRPKKIARRRGRREAAERPVT